MAELQHPTRILKAQTVQIVYLELRQLHLVAEAVDLLPVARGVGWMEDRVEEVPMARV